ncbi:MAG: hypothetical protein HY291_19185 [Planctomycetes bacterium]|nr:hypothetical protein [Planctomycetota bacterium]
MANVRTLFLIVASVGVSHVGGRFAQAADNEATVAGIPHAQAGAGPQTQDASRPIVEKAEQPAGVSVSGSAAVRPGISAAAYFYFSTGGNAHRANVAYIIRENGGRLAVDQSRPEDAELAEEADAGEAGAATPKTRARDKQVQTALADLALWMQDGLYNEPSHPIQFDAAEPELNSSLEDPATGPALSTSHYAKLVSMLSEAAHVAPPSPKDLVAGIETLWERQWRRNLGFDGDPSCRQLLGDLERATLDARAAGKRLENLNKRAETNDLEKLQLLEQRSAAVKDCERFQAREAALREVLERRLTFVRALTELLRLAPNGGFGPTFNETADPQGVQAAAAKVLAEIGPFAAQTVWEGFVEDRCWLRMVEGGASRPEREIHGRTMASSAAEALLCDARLDGLGVLAEFLSSNRPAPGAVLSKALELLDKLGSKKLRPEMLAALPRVLALRKHEDPEVANRAKWVFLHLLATRGGKVSLEDTIGFLAPLLKGADPQYSEAAWQFLMANTGQRLPKEPYAWLNLQKLMISQREKAEAEILRQGRK